MKPLYDKLDAFIEYLRDYKGVSLKSYETYRHNLQEALPLLEVFEKDGVLCVDLMPYRLHIKSKSKTTIAKKISIVRSFAAWLTDYYGLDLKLLNNTQIKLPKKLPKPVSFELIKEAVQDLGTSQRLYVTLIYALGLRISEASSLKLADIKEKSVLVTGKRDKQRILPLLPSVKKDIDEFIKLNAPKVFLFEKDGQKLSDFQLRSKINKIFKAIGVKVNPHQLRHSFASHMLNEGAKITDVSELLGHRFLSTTQIYTQLSSKLKLQNYQKAHPLCKDGDVL